MHYHPRVRVLKIGNTKPEQFSDSFIMLRRCFVCTVAFHPMLACVARVHATPQVTPLPKCIKEAQKHSQSQRSIKCIFVVVSIYDKFSPKNESSFTYLQNNILSRGKIYIILIVLQMPKEPLVSDSCWLISGSTPV